MRSTSIGLALLVGFAMAGCDRAPDESPGNEALVLRSYAAPGRAQELADVLNQLMVLGVDDSRRTIGKARVAPGDQVLVLAPDSVHEGLAEVIQAQLEGKAEAPPAQIAMSYWFVAARPVQDEPRYGSRLEEVRPVLEDLAEVDGAQEFSLYERIDLRQASGLRTRAESPKATIHQNASLSGRSVVVTLTAELSRGGNRLVTGLNLESGQFLVLGQASLDTQQPGLSSLEGSTLYIIVRAQAPSLP
jgi:hypothetical protein